MKRILFAFLVLVFLCIVSVTVFAVVTQRGIGTREINLYTDIDKSTRIQAEDEYLSTAAKSMEPLDEKPGDMNESVYLYVKYFAGINMGYRIFFNPVSGESCIEKGLITDRYYKLPDDYIYKIKGDGLYTVTNSRIARSQQINGTVYDEFRKSLVPVESIPGTSDDYNTYSIDVRLLNGNRFDYLLYADFLSDEYYVDTVYGSFRVDFKNIKQILSLDPIYSEYAEITQPIPGLVVSAGHILVPGEETVEWDRTKPNGESDTVILTDSSSANIKMPEPGTEILVDSEDGKELPDDVSITLGEYRDGEFYKEYDMEREEAYVPEFEGDLEYKLVADFGIGKLTYDYDINMDLPAKVTVPYPEARPGDILSFFVSFFDDDAIFSLKTNLGNQTADFRPYGDELVALVPINWWTSPGKYSVDVYRTQNQNTALYGEYEITVLHDDFETIFQQLVVSDELAEKADPANTANDAVMVAKAKSHSNETSYLDGTFILPLEGDFGTSYAQTRYINGENPYRHSGLDIDGNMGDPIIAANSGVVVMASELVRTGNTIIIDHGMNLFSSYLHMSEFDIKVGDFVNKGDLIGKVGSTGFSTGPHLHWSITLDGNYMSPLWLVDHPIVPD